jgi:hypothetical protein
MDGFIKIFRKLIEWEWFKNSETVHLFIYLILKANFKPSYFMGHDIPRGSLVCGRKQLAEDTGISEQSIRTILDRLKSTSEITSKSTNKFSIITICNYDSYQFDLKKSTNKSTSISTNNQPTTNQQLTTSEEVKKERKKEETLKSIAIPEHLKNIWPFYLEMRKLIKKPATDNAQESTIKKLERLAPGNNQLQIEIIQQSIDNSYQGVFPLKEQQNGSPKRFNPGSSEESVRIAEKYKNL